MESLLVWILMDKEERNNQRIADFMNNFYSSPMIDATMRQEYVSGLMEEAATASSDQNKPKYETNIEQLKLIKAMQEQDNQ